MKKLLLLFWAQVLYGLAMGQCADIGLYATSSYTLDSMFIVRYDLSDGKFDTTATVKRIPWGNYR